MKTADRKRAFTLMELLVVVMVISILVALLLPAILKARETARERKARAEIFELQKAWALYYQTYETLPSYSEMNASATQELGGKNPRNIVFMEFTPDELQNGFKDPWKELYHLEFKVGDAVKTKWSFKTRVQCMNSQRGKY